MTWFKLSDNTWKYLGICGIVFVAVHLLLMFLYPELAYATTPVEVFDKLVNKSGNAYNDIGTGEYGLYDLILTYAGIFKKIVMVIAVILVIVEGYTILMAEGDAAVVKKSGLSITWLLAGIVVMQIAETLINVFWKVNGIYGAISPTDKQLPVNFQEKILQPLLSFGMTFLAGIVTLLTIVTGVRILVAQGDDAKVKKLITTLATTITGLALIIIARPIVETFYGTGTLDPNPNKAISVFLQFLNYALGFVGLAAIIMIIVAGLMMVFYLGNDAVVGKARKTIYGVLIGLALILSAYTLVTFFLLPAFT